jgi:hypothetical protein
MKRRILTVVEAGRKGALALNASLTPEERKKSAERAAAARWGKKKAKRDDG